VRDFFQSSKERRHFIILRVFLVVWMIKGCDPTSPGNIQRLFKQAPGSQKDSFDFVVRAPDPIPGDRGDCPLSPSCTMLPVFRHVCSQLIVGVGPPPDRE
jgi:hypothetical protein